MKIERILTLSTEEQKIIEDFGNLISNICDSINTSSYCASCVFGEFCSSEQDVSYNFLELVKSQFNCDANMSFED